MKIAVIGRGSVGGTLGRAFTEAGHEVVYGVRSPKRDDETSPKGAVSGADAVVLALPWKAVPEVLEEVGNLEGDLVLDCTNPLRPTPSGLALEGDESAAAGIQRRIPAAAVYKVFNTVGVEIMANPVLEGRRAVMPFCGDDDARRDRVRGLVTDLGFEAVDVGGLEAARILEHLALLWITLASRTPLGREFAFGILRR